MGESKSGSPILFGELCAKHYYGINFISYLCAHYLIILYRQ